MNAAKTKVLWRWPRRYCWNCIRVGHAGRTASDVDGIMRDAVANKSDAAVSKEQSAGLTVLRTWESDAGWNADDGVMAGLLRAIGWLPPPATTKTRTLPRESAGTTGAPSKRLGVATIRPCFAVLIGLEHGWRAGRQRRAHAPALAYGADLALAYDRAASCADRHRAAQGRGHFAHLGGVVFAMARHALESQSEISTPSSVDNRSSSETATSSTTPARVAARKHRASGLDALDHHAAHQIDGRGSPVSAR